MSDEIYLHLSDIFKEKPKELKIDNIIQKIDDWVGKNMPEKTVKIKIAGS